MPLRWDFISLYVLPFKPRQLCSALTVAPTWAAYLACALLPSQHTDEARQHIDSYSTDLLACSEETQWTPGNLVSAQSWLILSNSSTCAVIDLMLEGSLCWQHTGLRASHAPPISLLLSALSGLERNHEKKTGDYFSKTGYLSGCYVFFKHED